MRYNLWIKPGFCFSLFTLLLWSFAFSTSSQINYKGIWQGYITASNSRNSGYTLHIEEQIGDCILGTAYIYRDENPFKFDGIFDFIGTINQTGSKITELEILKEKMPSSEFNLCIKYMGLDFDKKDNIDYLTGKWTGSLVNKAPCIPGNVYLRRYNLNIPKDIKPIPVEIMQAILADNSIAVKFLETKLAKPIIINVRNDILKFEIRDYLKEDNDTVSIYLNRRPLAQKIGILKKPYKQAFRLDKNSELNEMVLYAENLGLIPPNTSDLTIVDGKIKHKLMIQSSKQISAVIYLRYKPGGP